MAIRIKTRLGRESGICIVGTDVAASPSKNLVVTDEEPIWKAAQLTLRQSHRV
jgi:hypothetical protein